MIVTEENVISVKNDTHIINGTYFGKPCVIKKIFNDGNGIKTKILREIAVLKKCKHKCIVKLYDIYYDNLSISLILEKGENDLIDNLIESCKKTQIIKGIASAIKIMHDNSYIHGDLSLKNIVKFKNNDGSEIYKLIDFGSSVKKNREELCNVPTLYISPPEILEKYFNKTSGCITGNLQTSGNIDKIDSWALGCVSFYILTNDLPYIDNDNKMILKKIYDTNKSTLLDKLNENVNGKNNLKMSILNLLSNDPVQRTSVSQFYSNITNNITFKRKLIFKNNNLKQYNCSQELRNKLFMLLLILNLQNNVGVENIFITFLLLSKLPYDQQTYLQNGIIVYSLATKITSDIEISMFNIEQLILLSTGNVILNLNSYVNNILNKLSWDIDVETLYSYSINVPENIRIQYISLALIIICNTKYDIFQLSYLYKMICVLIFYYDSVSSGEPLPDVVNIDKYKLYHHVNEMMVAIKNIFNTDIEKVIKMCLKNEKVDHFLNWSNNFQMDNLKKLILNYII